MWKGNRFWEQMMEQHAGISASAPYQTIIEIAGHRRILIENHHGVVTYGSKNIVIKVQYGSVSVCGDNLEIMLMSKEQVVISGDIQNIVLNRRDCC